ncbi:MAG: glycosyltransferase [Bacteroides sp.]|nr:glycosyltransferase [Bacteroides sp.]
MNPLFSIITVTYNAASTLPATLHSVGEQTCKLYEYLIIDGASTDDTVKIAGESGIENMTIVSEPDRGLYDAMNKGLGIARGDYVIFLNAGDSFHNSGVLQLIADTVMDNDYPGIVYGQTQIVDSSRRRIGDRHLTAPSILTLDSFKDGMVVCHQAFIVLRKLVDNYDTRYKFSADFEWCIRCLQRSHRNCYIDRILIDYLSEGLTTANHRSSLWERFKIMSMYFGLFPTIYRHIKFFIRNLRRKYAAD